MPGASGRRFTVYLREELHARAIEELPVDLSLSSILAEGLERRIAQVRGCAHDRARCERCGLEGRLDAPPAPPAAEPDAAGVPTPSAPPDDAPDNSGG